MLGSKPILQSSFPPIPVIIAPKIHAMITKKEMNQLHCVYETSQTEYFHKSAYSSSDTDHYLTCLFPNKSINDEHITGFWMHYYSNLERHSSKSIQFVNPLLINGTSNEHATCASYARQGYHGKDVYIFPVNSPGHWFLIIYFNQPKESQFLILESLNIHHCQHAFPKYIWIFAWILQKYFGVKNLDAFPLDKVTFRRNHNSTKASNTSWQALSEIRVICDKLEPHQKQRINIWDTYWQQTNGHDCGLYVLLAMIYIETFDLYDMLYQCCCHSEKSNYPPFPQLPTNYMQAFRREVFITLTVLMQKQGIPFDIIPGQD